MIYQYLKDPIRQYDEPDSIDRELARFIYVREVKRFDPFKFSIYAWCIKIAIAGSLAPVRLAWVPFLGVPKKWVYLCGGRYYKNLCRIVAWCYGITNSSMPVTLNCTFVAPVTIKRPRKWIYSCEGRPKRCQVILKAEKCVLFGNHNASKIWLYQLLPASPFSSAKGNYFKMELDIDTRRDDDASPTSTEGMKAQLFT